MPLDLGRVADMNVRLQLYTVPGQVYYNSTRRLVLQGVDGVVFVADSLIEKRTENIESLNNLFENMESIGVDPSDVPLVLQYNKRDLPDPAPWLIWTPISIQMQNTKALKLLPKTA